MNILNVKDLSKLSIFKIRGKWGLKHLPGILIVKNNKCYLIINELKNGLEMNKISFYNTNTHLSEINGHGVIAEKGALNRPVYVKLLNLNKIRFINTDMFFAGGSLSLVYRLGTVMLYDKPFPKHMDNMNIDDNELYISNFSNFISQLYFSPEEDLKWNQVDSHFKKDFNKRYLSNNPIVFAENINDNCKYLICEHRRPEYIHKLNTDFIGYKLLFYIHIDIKNHAKLNAISSLQKKSVKWFSLLSDIQEINYKNLIYDNTMPINVMIFNNSSENDCIKNKSFKYFIDNKYNIYNLLESFKYWLHHFNGLRPIFNDLNINDSGTQQQQLQSICVSFESIYENFLKYSETNKKTTDKTEIKIKRVLKSMKGIPLTNIIEIVLSIIFNVIHTKVFINNLNKLIYSKRKTKYVKDLHELFRELIKFEICLLKYIKLLKFEKNIRFYGEGLPSLSRLKYMKRNIIYDISRIRSNFNLNGSTLLGKSLISHQEMYSNNLSKCVYSLRDELSHAHETKIAGREFANGLLNNRFAQNIVLLCLKLLVKTTLMKIIKINSLNIEMLITPDVINIQNNI